jgi:hypothetical protein
VGGFGNAVTSPQIEKHLRESITQVINEYHNLSGIGMTLGEGMEDMDQTAQAEWGKRVFFGRIRTANRKAKFIYRAALKGDHMPHRTAIDLWVKENLENPIIVELKFNWSHGHSTTTLVKAHGLDTAKECWTNPAPSYYKMGWIIRNEDFFRLRWGEPDFIREPIQKNGQDYVEGYFIGS